MSQGQSKYDQLINLAKQVPAVRGAVVHPYDESSLRGVVQAVKRTAHPGARRTRLADQDHRLGA